MLDEPLGALDAFTREELWDVLQKSAGLQRRFTTILVTHDLREAVLSGRSGLHDVGAAGAHSGGARCARWNARAVRT